MRLVLVKHARPVLDGSRPARAWTLGQEGEHQARALGLRLRPFRPVVVRSSTEPKARQTAAIVAQELGARARAVDGLQEIDRRRLDLVSRERFERLIEPLFADLERAVLGSESGAAARDRFGTAVELEVGALPADRNLVIVAHGTVIALFVAAWNPAVDAWNLWQSLDCGAYLVLRLPDYRLESAPA